MNYRPHLVAFLDILGFSEICLKSEKSNHDKDRIAAIFNFSTAMSETLKTIAGKQEIKVIIVSDSIILCLKQLGQDPTINEIGNFILAAGKYQHFLAKSGFWLRGGISCGELFVDPDEKQVVGPALINAINIEKNIAKFPRIVVDTNVLNKANFGSASDFRGKINNLFCEGPLRPLYEWRSMFDDIGEKSISQDVPFIVDFMRSQNESAFLEIASQINIGLNGPIQHYEKYRWLADYLLSTHSQRYIGHSGDKEKLRKLLY